MIIQEANLPAPSPPTLSESVLAENSDRDHLLEALKPCFPAITEVVVSNKTPFLAYNFKLVEPLGFWKAPSPEGFDLTASSQ